MDVDLIQDLNKTGIGNVKGYRDVERKKFRKVTQLDAECKYFFTTILNEDGSFFKYSFDIEDVDPVHYEFDREQEKELRKSLREFRSWMKTEEVLIEYLAKHDVAELEIVLKEILGGKDENNI